ncbi:MAG: GAF domain-containing protein [Candidatus Ratteibacteria bacterium]|nr:GAF domain-containing protein [Candidatus Ratteibacteria bacterium]
MNKKPPLSKSKENYPSLQKWKNKLFLMLRYSRQMNASMPIEKLLEILAKETKEILDADRCSVLLLDSEKKQLEGKIAHGINVDELFFPIDKGLAGFSAKTGKIINVKDAYKDKRFNREIDKKTNYKTKSVLCFPMKNHQEEVIGVFQALNKKEGHFNKKDEELLRILSSQAASAIENAQLYKELKKSFESFINTLVATIDARDPMTAGHSHKVTEYSVLIGKQLGISGKEMQLLEYAAILHDLGKIGVREAILTKRDSLTDEEYKQIKEHVIFTRNILNRIYFQKHLREIPLIAGSHHERIDGKGYPNALKGNAIHKLAKIITLADVFDSITNTRHYRTPMPIEKALTIIKTESNSHFEPQCVKAFMDISLDGLISVLSKDIIVKLKQQELKLFSDYTVGGFLKTIGKKYVKLSNKEKKVIERFNFYYLKGKEKDAENHKRNQRKN